MADTDRSTKNKRSLIQFEDTPGSLLGGEAPNLRLPGVSFLLQPNIENYQNIKGKGSTYGSSQQHGVEDTNVTVPDTGFTFNEFMYLLEMICGEATPTDLGNGAWRRVYQVGTFPRTASIDSGDPGTRIERALYCFLSGLSLKDGQNNIMMGGVGKGQAIDPDVTGADEGDIERIPQVPANALRSGLYLSLVSNAALGTPGAEAVSYAEDFAAFEWNIGNYYEVVVNKRPNNTSWDQPLESDASTGTAKIVLGAKQQAWDFLSVLRNDQIFYARDKITGPAIFAGVKQVETATAAGTASASGNITVTVTAAGMTGSPVAVVVAITSGDTPTVWAGKVKTALAANANIAAHFTVGGATTAIALTRKVEAADDATADIVIVDTGTTGITPVAHSTNTTAGVAAIPYLCAIDVAVAFNKHFNIAEQSPRDVLEFDCDLKETEEVNGWMITIDSPIADLQLGV